MEQVYNKRDYQRFSLDGSATLIVNKNLKRPLILKDLSARGVGVIGSFPLNLNEKVEVIMNTSFFFDKPLYKKAKVSWCNKIDENLWQAGLDFGLDNKINLG